MDLSDFDYILPKKRIHPSTPQPRADMDRGGAEWEDGKLFLISHF